MARPFWLLLDAALLALLLAACGSAGPSETATPQPQNFSLSPTEEAGGMDMRVGDTLELSFPSNPTTGYAWQVVEINPDVLRQLSEEYVQPTSDLLGASGVQVFRFEAVASGETLLKLAYFRSFEPDVPPEQTYQVKIVVR